MRSSAVEAATQKSDHKLVGSSPTDHSTLCADVPLRVIAALGAAGHSFVSAGGSS